MAETGFELDGPPNTVSYWTTVNASEALPGIITPLNWSWYNHPAEYSQVGVFKALGVVPASAADVPPAPDARFTAVFYGRYVVNVDTWRRYADVTPGMSGDALERQFFGSVRPGLQSGGGTPRWAAIAVKFPWTVLTSHRKMTRDRADLGRWQHVRLAELATAGLGRKVEIMFEAHCRFARAQATHILCSMVAQMIYQNLILQTVRVGLAGIENSLTTGYGLEEAAVQQELWAIAHGEGGSIARVVEHHGFTGPGEIARPSWREDTSIVRDLVERFRTLPADRRPSLVAARQRQEREDAEQRLLAASAGKGRLLARLLLAGARTYMPLRESGRAALLIGLDVGRAAVNAIGRELTARGILAKPDDIFFLDLDEIRTATGPGAVPMREVVEGRRRRRAYYETLSLPTAWTGTPEPAVAKVEAPLDASAVIQGLGVNGASVTGLARVIVDPADADDFEEGEILICPLTDPSWASLFVIAAGVVIDVGGPLSHGAIVAREMGLPCIINTKTGTRQIRTGMVVHLDGAAGTVRIVDAEEHAA